jgi:hypothetical protein
MAAKLERAGQQATGSEELEALFRETRELQRRRRRRRLLSVAAVAAGIVAGLIGFRGSGGGRHVGAGSASPGGGAGGERTSRVVGGGFATGLVALIFSQISGEVLWAANGFAMERSDDGGVRWTDITPANLVADDPGARIEGFTARGLHDLWFAASDAGDATAQGLRGFAIEDSSDGGARWQWTAVPCSDCLSMALSFVTAARGWALGTPGRLYTTADSGRRWSALPNAPAASSAPRGLTFTGALTGWLTTGPNLYVSHDGGLHWRPVRLPRATPGTAPFRLGRPQFFGRRVGVIPGVQIGGETVIYETSDAGKQWTAIAVPVVRQIGARGRWQLPQADFSTRKVWSLQLLNGPLAPLIVTANAGRSWTRVPEPPTYADVQPVWQFAMAIPTDGWLLAAAAPCAPGRPSADCGVPLMLRTTDTGRTWRVIHRPPAPSSETHTR